MTYLIVILIYLIFLVLFGLYFAFKVKKKDDFLVAGRNLTAPILVGTLLATWIGSGDIFSVADLSYNHGYSSLIGSAGGWLGIIIVFFIAGRVRDFGQYTVPDILEVRYNKWARILATITTIIAYVTIVSYQFRGGGWILNIISEGRISVDVAMIIIACFVIFYTVFAGMLSVAYLDIINGILILASVFISIPFLIHNAGGIDTIVKNVTPRENFILGNMSFVQAIGYFVPTFLLALGNGNMYQRFFSAKDAKEAKKSVIGWVTGVILIGVALQTLAVIGSSMFKGLEVEESGKIILLVAHRGLPVVIGCFLLPAIVAIVISTANSFLLVPATNVARDIFQRFIKPDTSDKQMIFISRLFVVILGIISYALINFYPRVLDAAYAAYTVYGTGLTPALMATFFWKRATPKGGVVSISAGMIVTVIWEIARKVLGYFPLGMPAIYPALVFSIVLLILVSLLDNKPPKEKWISFFKKEESKW